MWFCVRGAVQWVDLSPFRIQPAAADPAHAFPDRCRFDSLVHRTSTCWLHSKPRPQVSRPRSQRLAPLSTGRLRNAVSRVHRLAQARLQVRRHGPAVVLPLQVPSLRSCSSALFGSRRTRRSRTLLNTCRFDWARIRSSLRHLRRPAARWSRPTLVRQWSTWTLRRPRPSPSALRSLVAPRRFQPGGCTLMSTRSLMSVRVKFDQSSLACGSSAKAIASSALAI